MQSLAEVTVRPGIGPFPVPAKLGAWLTDLHHGLLRSAFSGQANVLLLSPQLRVAEYERLTLNTRAFRRAQADALGLDRVTRLVWARERRLCQAARLRLPDGRSAVVTNMHLTSCRADDRLADAELLRAAAFACGLASPEEAVVLAGDFNVTAARSRTLADLQTEWRFSAPGPGIDHVLVRDTEASSLRVWPTERRRLNGLLLSDHPPVELTVT
jgi:endonuclease/exonuclease/phosphatase family metal-dependent hydrolase